MPLTGIVELTRTPEGIFLGDTDPRSGPTLEGARADFHAKRGTCHRRGSNLNAS
jgi:hypothetical protein